MNFRTGVAVGATAYLAGRSARTALRRLRPVHRLAAYYEARLERALRSLVVRAEQGGPLTKAALAGVRALSQGRSPLRALLSAGRTAVRQTLAGIFGLRGGRGRPTTIVEQLDIGAPRRLVHGQWTRFQEFPSFMNKAVTVDQTADEKVAWKAKVFWSSRGWRSTIVQQVPDEHIAWKPEGRVDGTVSFHEPGPDLTRVLLVIEYRPRGLVERIGNLWRAPGRRARLELKHFRRHVMTRSLLDPDRVGGLRGEIRDGQVVRTREPAETA